MASLDRFVLFCEACGALKQAVRGPGGVEHICPVCGGGEAPGFSRAVEVMAAQRRAVSFVPVQQARPVLAHRPAAQVARTGEPPPGAGRYFPFPKMRKGQADFVADVRKALIDKKILVAQVPTGLGKTAGVLAPALEVAKETGAKVFFLTPKQSQHRVVIETMRLAEKASGSSLVVSDMIAKKAMCPRVEAITMGSASFAEFCSRAMAKNQCSYYEDKVEDSEVIATLRGKIHHVEEAVRVSSDAHCCPFKVLTAVGVTADLVVLDYNHFFSELLSATIDRFKFSLENAILIVDEAHNLPERIREHLTKALHPTAVAVAAREASNKRAVGLARFLEKFEEYVRSFENKREEVLAPEELTEVVHQLLLKAYPLHAPSLVDVVDEMREVGAKIMKDESYSACLEVADFLEQWPPHPKVREQAVLRLWSPDEGAIVHRILDAAVLARPIFERVRGAVLMSGTLFPMEMYGSILGVPKEKAEYALYANPFPPENRRVAIDLGVTTALKERSPETFWNIAQRIGRVCGATPGNVAAFFPSYDMLDRVMADLPVRDREILVEEKRMDKTAREGLVTRVRRANGRALLLGVQGGSLSEGYDFVEGEDNLLASVIVVGIPYAVPTLEVEALKTFFDVAFGNGKGWLYGYLVPAIQRTMQAAGRGVRAEHHRAFIGLVDLRFNQRNVRQWMPPDVQPDAVPDVGRACAEFYGPQQVS